MGVHSKKKKINNSRKINTVKALKKTMTKNTRFIGSGQDLLFGLIYLAKKYKNLDIPMKFNTAYGYKKEDFMNYGVRFECKNNEKKHKLIFPLNTKYFFDIIKKSKKRFVGIYLYINWDCASDNAHFNALLFDNKNKTIERFEPYSFFSEKKYFNISSKFDKAFSKILKKYLDFNYILPTNFCPNKGFQQKEENSLLNSINIKTIGNYQLKNDPGGFCGAWSLYFLNLRVSNPNSNPNELLTNIYKYLDSDKHSFRTFIRNYSNFITKERTNLLKKYNMNSNNDLHRLLEDKFSILIDR